MKKLLYFIILIILFYTGTVFAGHQGIGVQTCTPCHTPNLINQHGGFAADTCWLCHASTYINVVDTILKGEQGQPVYCSDCHGTAGHIENHPDYIANWSAYRGVEPGSAPEWTQVTNFTFKDPATEEYQVCFKCHSYYGFGEAPGGVTDIIGPSGNNLTDQAMEYNPANKSAHPVEVTLNNQTGSYSPRALKSSQMLFPWMNVGNQTLNCSDCHEVVDTGTGFEFALKGTNKYWPESSSGRLFSLNDISGRNRADSPYDVLNTNWSNEIFCLNCHDSFPSSNKDTWRNDAHKEHDDRDYEPTPDNRKHNAYCISCHANIPHGNKVSRLIVYRNQPAPYTYWSGGINYSALSGFKKPSGTFNYDKKNCYSTLNGCDDHKSNEGGYD